MLRSLDVNGALRSILGALGLWTQDADLVRIYDMQQQRTLVREPSSLPTRDCWQCQQRRPPLGRERWALCSSCLRGLVHQTLAQRGKPAESVLP